MLLSTSGTTGSSKYAKLSRLNLFSNTKSIIKSLGIKKNDTTITTLPLNYSYGMSIINTHLFKGSRIILTENSFINKNFLMLLSKYRVQSFGTVPFIIQLILKFKLYDKFNKDLKYITQAGGKLNLQEKIDFIKICKNKKIKFISMYGTTEASPRVSILPWKYSLKKPDSIGKPITDCEIFIFNNLGKRIITANTEGEFVLKGKNIFQGYANSRKRSY